VAKSQTDSFLFEDYFVIFRLFGFDAFYPQQKVHYFVCFFLIFTRVPLSAGQFCEENTLKNRKKSFKPIPFLFINKQSQKPTHKLKTLTAAENNKLR
jgi:hypothetical protein